MTTAGERIVYNVSRSEMEGLLYLSDTCRLVKVFVLYCVV